MVKTVKSKKFVAPSLKIGIDLDGVVIDHTNNKILKAKEMGFKIAPEQTPGHRLRKIVGEENYQKIRKSIYGHLTEIAPPARGALECLQKIKKLSVDFYIISARHKKIQAPARRWIDNYLLNIFTPKQIFFAEEESNKKSVCRKLKIDIYLDDKVSVLEMLSVPKLFLYDPYQIKNDYTLKNIQSVSSWRAFFECVKKQNFQPHND